MPLNRDEPPPLFGSCAIRLAPCVQHAHNNSSKFRLKYWRPSSHDDTHAWQPRPSGNDEVTQGRNRGLATGWCLQLLPVQSKQYLAVQLLTHTHSLTHTGPLPDSITHTSLTLLTQAEKHVKSSKGERRRCMWCKTPEWCVRDAPRGFAFLSLIPRLPLCPCFCLFFCQAPKILQSCEMQQFVV